MRRAAPLAHFGVDRPRDVVAGGELGRPARVGGAAGARRLDPAARLLLVLRVFVAALLGQVAPHEALALAVAQDAALAADRLGHQEPADAGRPDHAGRVELHELHVDQLRVGQVGQGVPVAGVLPRVRGDLVGAPDAAGGEDDRPGRKDDRRAALAPVAEGAADPPVVDEEARDRALHVDLDARDDGAVLERADHLEPGPVPDVGQARVRVAAERPLEDPAVPRPVEGGAPALQLANPRGRLLGVELRHAPVVEQRATLHRVAEVRLPGVLCRHVGERGGHPALGHHRVGLAQQRLADEPHRCAGGGRLDRRPEPGAAGAHHEDVVRVRLQPLPHPPLLRTRGADRRRRRARRGGRRDRPG